MKYPDLPLLHPTAKGATRKGLERERPWGSRSQKRREALEAAGIEIGYETVEKVRLRYGIRHGTGLPLLICNGLGANLEILAALAKAIPERPVILFDVPGTGGSEDAWFCPGQRYYAHLTMRLLDHLGHDKVVVAGISWGGTLAQQIARDYPKRVCGLVLMATTPGFMMVPGDLRAMVRLLTPVRYLSRGYMARNAPTIYGGEMRNNPSLAIEYAALTRAPSTRSYLQQLTTINLFSSLPWLRRLKVPSLVMSGDDDPLVNKENARLIAALLPNSELRIIPAAGHLFMILRARQVAGWIETFIRESCTAETAQA